MILLELFEKSQADRKASVGVEADQFFTRPEVADNFASWIKGHEFMSSATRIIEPATGSKDLANHFDNIEMYDLFPQSPDITAQDFLTSDMGYKEGTVVVMNPPYGKSSDLAIKFFNKAASISDHIAMIVPRTFRRTSVQKQLDMTWHLVDEYVLPNNSFYLPAEDKMRPYNVPAVAQIWERREEVRHMPDERTTTPHFQFLKPSDVSQATFAIRKKGRRAGQVVKPDQVPNPNSFFYINGDDKALSAFLRVDWKELGNDVMGARNLSQTDIIQAVEQQYN
jgi:hypothetical protein